MPEYLAHPTGVYSAVVLRRLLIVFIPAALFTGAVVLVLYYQDRANEQSLYEQAGAHVMDLQGDIVARELDTVVSDLLYLAGQAALRHYLADSTGGREELQGEYLLFCRQRAVYDQIRYLDPEGRERVRVNFNDGRPAIVADAELQPKADRYYFVDAWRLARGEVFVSPFDLNVEHGQIELPLKPTIRFATPVFDDRGTKRGVIVLNFLGVALLRKLAEVSHTFPGTTLLLNRDGHYLRGPNAHDEWGFMLDHDRSFAIQRPEAWDRIKGAEAGQFRAKGGLFTYRSLAHHGARGSPAAGDAGLIVVAYTPPEMLEGGSSRLLRRLLLLYAVVVLVLLPLAWYLAYVGSLRRAHERQLAQSEARLRALSSQLLTAQEEERRGISRDLHDELGQVGTAITLDLQRAAQAVDPGKKDELTGRALHGANCLLDRIHEIAARIRPAMLDDLGLKDAVQNLLGEHERRGGAVPKLDLRFEHEAVPTAISQNVYRILQEALTNVARHSQAKEVFVGLYVTPNAVSLTVRDAGVGFDVEAREDKRLGILGMRERAELLGGTFAVDSKPGKGTEIHVVIPLAGKVD